MSSFFCIEDNFQISFKKDGLLAQPHVPPSSCIFKKPFMWKGKKEEIAGKEGKFLVQTLQGNKDLETS